MRTAHHFGCIGLKRKTLLNVSPGGMQDGPREFSCEDRPTIEGNQREEEGSRGDFRPAIFGHEQIV